VVVDGRPLVIPRADGSRHRPEAILARTLEKLKADAEAYLGRPVSGAVIAVPTHYDLHRRDGIVRAGHGAGIDVVRTINAPTAASLAYGLRKTRNETILVFDLGGGSLDVCVVDVGDGVFEVKATNGDRTLGGVDYDRRILDWLAREYDNEHGIDLRADCRTLQHLTDVAEQAKIELSSRSETTISLPSAPDTTLTRAKFEALTADLTERCRGTVLACAKDAGVTSRWIDEVVLVGGSTRMPAVRRLLKELAGGRELYRGVNPDEVVAAGAAIQAAVIFGAVKDVLLLDAMSSSLGVEIQGGAFSKVIERNTTFPTSRVRVFSTAADDQTSAEVHVLQGEGTLARDNRTVGRFILDGIAPAPRGTARIDVTFEVDAAGAVRVSASDRDGGHRRTLSVTATGAPSWGRRDGGTGAEALVPVEPEPGPEPA
jgi:molecular chaperone DnaK